MNECRSGTVPLTPIGGNVRIYLYIKESDSMDMRIGGSPESVYHTSSVLTVVTRV